MKITIVTGLPAEGNVDVYACHGFEVKIVTSADGRLACRRNCDVYVEVSLACIQATPVQRLAKSAS
jgi:hypothetical protein